MFRLLRLSCDGVLQHGALQNLTSTWQQHCCVYEQCFCVLQIFRNPYLRQKNKSLRQVVCALLWIMCMHFLLTAHHHTTIADVQLNRQNHESGWWRVHCNATRYLFTMVLEVVKSFAPLVQLCANTLILPMKSSAWKHQLWRGFSVSPDPIQTWSKECAFEVRTKSWLCSSRKCSRRFQKTW